MTKEIIEALKNNTLIEDEIYLDYIGERLEEEDLTDHINGTVFTTDDNSGYVQQEGILYFNPDIITWDNTNKKVPSLDSLISKREKRKRLLKEANTSNLYNLFVINHEIRHIMQDKIMVSKEKSILRALFIKDTISLLLNDNAFKNFYYEKYHDRFFLEYDANITSYIKTLDILNNLDLDNLNDLLIKTNKIIADHLIYCYSDIDNTKKTSTPIKNMYRLYNHITNKCEEHDINLDININYGTFKKGDKPKEEIEKLKYGLAIKKETYDYLKQISKGKVKTLNLFEQIKNN